MSSESAKKHKPLLFRVLYICFVIVGAIMVIISVILFSVANREFKEMSEAERIHGEVVELKIKDSYVHAVVEYTYQENVHQITWKRNDLYQGQILELVPKNEDASEVKIYIDNFFQYGKTVVAMVLLIMGLVFLVLLPLILFGIEKFMSSEKVIKIFSIEKLFFAIAIICGVIIAIVAIVSPMIEKKPEINKDDYAQTQAVLINVPEYEEKEEKYTDSDGDTHYRTVTYYYGDTVAGYQVNGKDFRTVVYNSKDNYEGKAITLYYHKEKPGLTRTTLDINNSSAAWIPILIFSILGGSFLLVAILFKVIDMKEKKKQTE